MINKATRSFKGVVYTGMRLHKKALSGIEMPDGEVSNLQKVMCFSDDKGRDWYDEREDNDWGAIVATDRQGIVCAMADTGMNFIPIEGYDIWEVDPNKLPSKAPMDVLGMYRYDGETFEKL